MNLESFFCILHKKILIQLFALWQEYVLGEIKKLQKYPADDEDLPPDDFNRVYEDQGQLHTFSDLNLISIIM